ncbi:hypothetical protein GCM10025778_23270 [Paeniglutamicibacter antarcticus]|uniref:Uncharacterized protein n=1 Tax=Paeniglutamicibacter antarcticus TaxID=494023 RepID=A0ABP9TLU8_9MICC
METSGANTVLYLATSLDGIKWELGESPLIAGASGKWDDTNIYRATILPADGVGGIVADIWYSARSATGKWRTGRTTLRWADPAVETRAPLAAVAQHTNAVESKDSTRNLIANATLLASIGTRPAGTTNNLVGATGQGREAALDAYKFTMPGSAAAFTLVFAGLPVTANLSYTFTFYGASDTDGHPMSARLLWLNSGGTALRTDQPASAIARPRGGRFARIRLTATATAPVGAVTVEAMMANGAGLGTSVIYYWKKAQLEQSAEPTELTPGVADRHVAIARQTRNLSEWLGPVTGTGQAVLAAVTANGAFQAPRLATDNLPPAAENEGVAFYGTTRKMLVHSDGIAGRVMSTMSTRTVRVVAGGATLTHEDEIVVVTAGSFLPPITQTRPIPVGRMFTIKNGSAAAITFLAADGKEVNGSTASTSIPAWGATSVVWTGTMWVTIYPRHRMYAERPALIVWSDDKHPRSTPHAGSERVRRAYLGAACKAFFGRRLRIRNGRFHRRMRAQHSPPIWAVHRDRGFHTEQAMAKPNRPDGMGARRILAMGATFPNVDAVPGRGHRAAHCPGLTRHHVRWDKGGYLVGAEPSPSSSGIRCRWLVWTRTNLSPAHHG